MLISLFAWIYITFICFVWGQVFLSVVIKEEQTAIARLDTPLICLAGLALISTLALGLAIFMPLDWKAHLIIGIPAIAWCLRSANRHLLITRCSSIADNFSPASWSLLAACMGMTLVISAHTITHPDTLGYHARSILLFQQYGSVPGIANLKAELGLQSSWFAVQGLFLPLAPGSFPIIFVNGAVLCWYFLFLIRQQKNGCLWLMLLSFTLISFTQTRLTAASASPDFIVTLFSWAAIYMYIGPAKKDSLSTVLVVLFSLAAILTKLSAIVMLLLAATAMAGSIRLRRTRPMIAYACVALIILFIRNYIASGYLLYPSPLPDLVAPSWKMSPAVIHSFRHYVSVFARYPVAIWDVTAQEQLPFRSWIPRWWHFLAIPDRILILGTCTGLALFPLTWLAQPQKTPGSEPRTYTQLLLLTLAGCLLWFLEAPDPRFGTGILVPLLYLLFRHFPFPQRLFSISMPQATRLATYCLAAALTAYTSYRCYHFLTPSEMLYPSGIANTAYEPLGCENISVDLLQDSIIIKQPALLPAACKYGDFGGFAPQGRTIAEGFRPADGQIISSDTSSHSHY